MRLSVFVPITLKSAMLEVASHREIAKGARKFDELRHRHRMIELQKIEEQKKKDREYEQQAGHVAGKVIKPTRKF